ncbi:hypothetical protein RHODOSMS8_00054 [Rhodobiaceae bacterium]|nr:hypothetical protein RHODOSMS8_00054 [Rhodobiaceae bacterium]
MVTLWFAPCLSKSESLAFTFATDAVLREKWCPGASSNGFYLSVTYAPVGHFYFLVFTYVYDESVPLFLHPLAPLYSVY